MKKFIITLMLLLSVTAQATCNWKTGITPGPNKTFIYSQECHEAVGQLVQANKDLTAAIQLKDLAIQTSDSRVILWQKSANDEFDKLNQIESEQKHNDWLFFGGGVLATVLTGFMTARLIGK
jgi:hypothetical protein